MTSSTQMHKKSGPAHEEPPLICQHCHRLLFDGSRTHHRSIDSSDTAEPGLSHSSSFGGSSTSPELFHASLDDVTRRMMVSEIAFGKEKLSAPLCCSCAAEVIAKIKRRQEEVEAECTSFAHHLAQLRTLSPLKATRTAPAASACRPDDITQAMHNLALDDSSVGLFEAIRREGARQIEEKRLLEARAAEIAEQERELSLQFDDHEMEKQRVYRVLSIQQARAACCADRLEGLLGTNVYRDAFPIGSDGTHGTINGLRLGISSAHTQADWDVLNAALGQCVLLLDAAARACGLTRSRYKLLAMGSSSKIAWADDIRHPFQLHGSVTIFLSPNRLAQFNFALKCFLSCVGEVAARFGELNHTFQLKYRIRDDSLYSTEHGQLSDPVPLSLESGQEARLNRALRRLLLNLKLLLSWCAVLAKQRSQQRTHAHATPQHTAAATEATAGVAEGGKPAEKRRGDEGRQQQQQQQQHTDEQQHHHHYHHEHHYRDRQQTEQRAVFGERSPPLTLQLPPTPAHTPLHTPVPTSHYGSAHSSAGSSRAHTPLHTPLHTQHTQHERGHALTPHQRTPQPSPYNTSQHTPLHIQQHAHAQHQHTAPQPAPEQHMGPQHTPQLFRATTQLTHPQHQHQPQQDQQQQQQQQESTLHAVTHAPLTFSTSQLASLGMPPCAGHQHSGQHGQHLTHYRRYDFERSVCQSQLNASSQMTASFSPAHDVRQSVSWQHVSQGSARDSEASWQQYRSDSRDIP